MELSTKQKQTVMQAQNKMKDKRQNVFVLSELNELPEETKTYQAVGKMFVLRDKVRRAATTRRRHCGRVSLFAAASGACATDAASEHKGVRRREREHGRATMPRV